MKPLKQGKGGGRGVREGKGGGGATKGEGGGGVRGDLQEWVVGG